MALAVGVFTPRGTADFAATWRAMADPTAEQGRRRGAASRIVAALSRDNVDVAAAAHAAGGHGVLLERLALLLTQRVAKMPSGADRAAHVKFVRWLDGRHPVRDVVSSLHRVAVFSACSHAPATRVAKVILAALLVLVRRLEDWPEMWASTPGVLHSGASTPARSAAGETLGVFSYEPAPELHDDGDHGASSPTTTSPHSPAAYASQPPVVVPATDVAGLALRPGRGSLALEPCPVYGETPLALTVFLALRAVLDLAWRGAWDDANAVHEVLALRHLWAPLFRALPHATDAIRAVHGAAAATRARDEWAAAVGALSRVGSVSPEGAALLAGVDSITTSHGFIDAAVCLANDIVLRPPQTAREAAANLLTATTLLEATLTCIVSCLSFNKVLVACFERHHSGYDVVGALLKRIGDGFNSNPHEDVTLQQLKQAVHLPLVLLAVSGAPTLTAHAVEEFVRSSSSTLDIFDDKGDVREWCSPVHIHDDSGFDSPGSLTASDDASPASMGSPASYKRGPRDAESASGSEMSDETDTRDDNPSAEAPLYPLITETIPQMEEVRNLSALDAELPWCNPHAFSLLVQAFKSCIVDFRLRNLLLKTLLFAMTKFLRQYLHRADADALWAYAPIEAITAVYHTDLDVGMQRAFMACFSGLVDSALTRRGADVDTEAASASDRGDRPSRSPQQEAAQVFTDALVYDLTCVVRLLRPPVGARLVTMAQEGCGRWFAEGMERVLGVVAKLQKHAGVKALEVLRKARLCETLAELLHSGFGWNNVPFVAAVLAVMHTQCKKDRQSVRHILTHCHSFLHDLYALMLYIPPQSPSTFAHFRPATSLLYLFSPEHDVVRELLLVLKAAPLGVSPHDALAVLADIIPCPHCPQGATSPAPSEGVRTPAQRPTAKHLASPEPMPSPADAVLDGVHTATDSAATTPSKRTAVSTLTTASSAPTAASPYGMRPRCGPARAQQLDRAEQKLSGLKATTPVAHLPDPIAQCAEVSERTCLHRQHPHIRRADPPEVVLVPETPLKRAFLRRKIALALIKLMHKTPTASSDFLQGGGFALLADACEADAAEAAELCSGMIAHHQCRDGHFVGLPPGTSPIDAVSKNASWFYLSESGLVGTGGAEGRDILWQLHGNLLTYMAAATEAATRTGAAGCLALDESQFGARVLVALEKMGRPHLPGSTILLALGLLRISVHATCLPSPDVVCIQALLRYHKLPTTIQVPLLPSDQHRLWAVYHPKVLLAALRLTRPKSPHVPDAWWTCASMLHRHVLDTVRKIVEATAHNVAELGQANFIGELLDETLPLLLSRQDEALCDSFFNVVRVVGRLRVAIRHVHILLQHSTHPFLGRWCIELLRDWATHDNPSECGPHHYLSFPSFKDDHAAPDQTPAAILPRLHVTPWASSGTRYTLSLWARFEPMECAVNSPKGCYVLASSYAHTEDAVLITEVCLSRTGAGSADRRLFCRVAMADEALEAGGGASSVKYYNAYVPSLRELKPYKWHHIAVTHHVDAKTGAEGVEHTFEVRVNGGVKQGRVEKNTTRMEGTARVTVPGKDKFRKFAKRGGKLACMVLGASLIDYLFTRRVAAGAQRGAPPTSATQKISHLFRSGVEEELYQGRVDGFASVQLGSLALLWGALTDWQAYLLFCLGRDYCGDFNEPLANYHSHGVLTQSVCAPQAAQRPLGGAAAMPAMQPKHDRMQEAAAAWLASAVGLAEGIQPAHNDGLHERLIMVISARAGGYNAFVASRVVSTEATYRRPRATPVQAAPGTPTPVPTPLDLSRASDDEDADSSSLGVVDGARPKGGGTAVPLIRVQADVKVTHFTAAPVELYGAATCMANQTLKSQLRSVGGMASIVSLVSLAANHQTRVASVHLLCELMMFSAENTQSMSADGFSALAWYLKKTRVTVDHALLEACFRLAGIEADGSGVLQDIHAVKLVLMDWGIWSRGPISVQQDLLLKLERLVATHPLGKAHRSVLLHAGVVPWVLNHTLMHASDPAPFDIRVRAQALSVLHAMFGGGAPRRQVAHRVSSRAPCLVSLTVLLRYFIATARRSVEAVAEQSTEEERAWRRGLLKLFLVLLARLDDGDLPAVLKSVKNAELSGPDVFLGLLADPCPRVRLLVLACISWFLQHPSTRAYFTPEAIVSQYAMISIRSGGGGTPAAPASEPLDATDPSVSELQLLLLMLLHRPRRGGPGGAGTPTEQPLGGALLNGPVRQPALPAIFLQTVGACAVPSLVSEADAAALAHAAREVAAAALPDAATPRVGVPHSHGGTPASTPGRTPNTFAAPPPAFAGSRAASLPGDDREGYLPHCAGASRTAMIFHNPECLDACLAAPAGGADSPSEDGADPASPRAALHDALGALSQLVDGGHVPGSVHLTQAAEQGDLPLPAAGSGLGRPFGLLDAMSPPGFEVPGSARRRGGTVLDGGGYTDPPLLYHELALPLLRPLLLLVETALSPSRPDLSPLRVAQLRFKRAMVVDALHTIFKQGSVAVKLKFFERDGRVGDDIHDRSVATLLVRLFLPRIAAGDADFAAMVLALLGDVVAWGVVDLPEAGSDARASTEADPMAVLENTLTAVYALGNALTEPTSKDFMPTLPGLSVTRWVYHLQQHILHHTLLRFRKRFLEPEARGSQSLLSRFVGFSEMCVDTVQSWRFIKKGAGGEPAKGPLSTVGTSTAGAHSPHPHSPDSAHLLSPAQDRARMGYGGGGGIARARSLDLSQGRALHSSRSGDKLRLSGAPTADTGGYSTPRRSPSPSPSSASPAPIIPDERGVVIGAPANRRFSSAPAPPEDATVASPQWHVQQLVACSPEREAEPKDSSTPYLATLGKLDRRGGAKPAAVEPADLEATASLSHLNVTARSRANALSVMEGSTTQEARSSVSASTSGHLPPQLVWLLPPPAPPNPSEWMAVGGYALVSPSLADRRQHGQHTPSRGSQAPPSFPITPLTSAATAQHDGSPALARALNDDGELWDELSDTVATTSGATPGALPPIGGEAGHAAAAAAAAAPPEEVRSFLFWLFDTIRTSLASAATLHAGRSHNRLLRKMNRSKLPKEALTLQLKRLLLELLALPSSRVAHPLLPSPEAAIRFALATLISCQVDHDGDAAKLGGGVAAAAQNGWCAKHWSALAAEIPANSLLASLTKKDDDPSFVEQVLYHTSPRLRVASGVEALHLRKVWKYILEGREHAARKIFDPSVLPSTTGGAAAALPGGCVLFALLLTNPAEHDPTDPPQIDARYTHPTTSSEDRLFSTAFVASGLQTRLKETNKIAKRLEDKAVRTVLVEHPRPHHVNYPALDARAQRVQRDFDKVIRHARQRRKDARGIVGRLVRSRVMLQGLWGAAAAVYTKIPIESMHLNWRLDDVEGPDRVRVRMKRFLALPLVEELGLVENPDDDDGAAGVEAAAAAAAAPSTGGLPPRHPGPPPADTDTDSLALNVSSADLRKALSQNRPSTAAVAEHPAPAPVSSPMDDEADDEIQALIDHQFEPGMAGPEEDMDDLAHTRHSEMYACSQVTPMVRVEGKLVFYNKALYYVSHDSPYRDDLAKVDVETDSEDEGDEDGAGAQGGREPAGRSPKSTRERSREAAERMKEKEKARKKKMVHRMHLHAVRHRVTAWYSEISGVFRRRYLLVNNSLEFFTERGLAFFFSFESEAVREKVFHALLTRCPRAREMSPSAENLKRWRDRWQKGELTNFQYLMLLNTMSGRSFNDLTQYPIFPHVIADYTSEKLDLDDPKSYRDFSKPMGVQTEDRLKRCETKYQQTMEMHEMLKAEMGSAQPAKGDSGGFSTGLRSTLQQLGFGWMTGKGKEDKDYTDIDLMALPPYHHGTHFSNRATVLYYCIRLQPFTDYFCELNDLKLDVPDRSFHSMHRAWMLSSAISSSDVKELTPEFFSLPDFLVNSNRMLLGVKQDKDTVDHLELPPWANGDPRLFVSIQRKALEGPWVSSQLHHWINLIFGYKASGQNAVEALNCFHPYAYEGAVNVDMISDPIKRQSAIDIINNFGQMPQQLLTKRHAKRAVERIYGSRDVSWWQVGRPVKKVCEAPFGERGTAALQNIRVEVRKGVVWSLRAECTSKETATTRAIDSIAQEDADDEVFAATSERRNCILLMHSSFEPGSDLTVVGTKSRAETLSYCAWDNCVRIQPYHADDQTNRNALVLKQSTRADMLLTAATSATDAAHIAFGTENGLVEVYGYAGSSAKPKRHSSEAEWRRWEVPDAEPGGFGFVPAEVPEKAPLRRNAPASTVQFTHDDTDARHRVLRPLATLHGHSGGVVTVVISKEFNIIVSGGVDGRVVVWDLLEFTFIRSMSAIVDGQCAQPVLQKDWKATNRTPTAAESITLVDANPATGDIIAVSMEKTPKPGGYSKISHQLNLWNINGVELSSVKLEGQATCTQFTGTLLAVGLLTGRILLLSAYDLTPLAAPLCPRPESPITALATNEGQTKLYTSHQQATPQGTQSVITTWMVTTK